MSLKSSFWQKMERSSVATVIELCRDTVTSPPRTLGRLVRLELLAKAGATHYLSGPAAKSYIAEEEFQANGIEVEWMDYTGYPEYPQFFPPFEHGVSIIDLLFQTGPDAGQHLNRLSAAQ